MCQHGRYITRKHVEPIEKRGKCVGCVRKGQNVPKCQIIDSHVSRDYQLVLRLTLYAYIDEYIARFYPSEVHWPVDQSWLQREPTVDLRA